MRADLELRLVHDGSHWIVSNGELQAKGSTFEALDEDLKQVLLNRNMFQSGQKISVFMGYDFSTFPTWLRQYHTHYFNRLANIEL